MQQFRYEALNSDGALFSGVVRAGSEREAARALERRGLAVVTLREGAAEAAGPRRTPRLRRGRIESAARLIRSMIFHGVTGVVTLRSVLRT